MIKQISTNHLDEADDTFVSLESEHRNSPLLPSALMIIAMTHIDEEEYELAVYYLDDYIKRFENNSLRDYVKFLKIKAKFFAFKQQFREQELIDNTLKDIEYFISFYPNSSYIYLVKSMQSRLLMAKALLNTEISALYDKKGKHKAVEFYNEKAQESWAELETIKDVSTPWYRYIFE
jgi:outer membrane protein assembly factor BamD